MVYNDVATPARAGTTNAKHGGGVVLTPGINIDQVIDAGVTKPVATDESKLTSRFDDTLYYNNTLTGNLEFYSNAEWVVPNGVTQITVKAFGQGGYGQTATGGNAGHGGGGAAYSESTFNVTAGTIYSITVNGGPVGGDGVNTKLKRGQTTILLAAAGKSGANGGAGGNILDCIGDTIFEGGDGADPSGFGGGGGGGSSNQGHGGFASGTSGGTGGGEGGTGGNGGEQFGGNQSDGFPGSNFGGGGGGGSHNPAGPVNYLGGAGGLGKLTITW